MKAFENIRALNLSPEVNEGTALSFVFLIALLTTLFDYQFVSLVQIDMLPMIYRAADPNFLLNDFFTNSSQLFNEDFIFAKLIGGLGKVFGIPSVVFSLTMIANIGISITAYFTVRDLSQDNRLSGMFAALLIMSLQTFQWGNRAEIFRYDLTPEHLIMPFLILCIWQGVKQRIFGVGLFAAVATVIHPLSGPGVGGIMLLQILVGKTYRKELYRVDWLKFIIAGVLISIPAMIYLLGYVQSLDYQMSNALFIEIMKVRFPHHYLPSFFLSPMKLTQGLIFLAVAAFCWVRIKRSMIINQKLIHSLIIISIILVLICFIGWFFVEIIPNRFIITLQLWRFLTIAKLLGTIGIAMFLGRQLSSLKETLSSLKSAIILVIVFAFSIYWSVEPKLMACFLVLMTLVFISRKLYLASLVLVLLFVIHNNLLEEEPAYSKHIVFSYFSSNIEVSSLNDPEAELAHFIKQNTDTESRILCGPRNGRLRILAKRALVIDAYGIPMNDKGLEEWWSRLHAVYLQSQNRKLSHIQQTEQYYNELEDRDFLALEKEYDFDYVVVGKEHDSKLKMIYQNNYFKLLEMPK